MKALRVIAVYELIGGSLGVALMGWLRIKSPTSLPWGDFLTASLPFGLIATAGLRLFQQSSGGVGMSLVAQLLQSAFWSIRGMVWKICAGPYVSFTLHGDHPTLSAGFDVSLLIGGGGNDREDTIGLNLLAMTVLGFL